MNKKEQLRQKLQRQQAILAAARTAGRDMTEDETREFNSLQNDIETLRPEADAEAEAEAVRHRLRPPAPQSANASPTSPPCAGTSTSMLPSTSPAARP